MVMEDRMNSSLGLRFLRPYLHSDVAAVRKSVYNRFFNTTRCLGKIIHRDPTGRREPAAGSQTRSDELRKVDALKWPRIRRDKHYMYALEFSQKYVNLKAGSRLKDTCCCIRGRVRSVRVAGKGLVFIDIVEDGQKVQVMCNSKAMEAIDGVSKDQFKEFYRLLRRGDIISVYGTPVCTSKGEPALDAIELPEILSPSVTSLPTKLDDREARVRNRHVDLLVNKNVADALRARFEIIQSIRQFLLKDKFLEVQTPILADKAGGAVAKPFTTHATEFPDKQLALRIAPELWLKRLVLGGMDRVFEIGPAFRNEGLDATHNPEFTTCEFYKSYISLEELIEMTESMFNNLEEKIAELRLWPMRTLPKHPEGMLAGPYKRISFIPAIETGLGQKLPDLAAGNVEEELIAIFKDKRLPLPLSPTLPRLLDKLSSIFIEPECEAPTFITYHPACMAPLAKSFRDKETGQFVSARAELFVQKREIANMYEEENSPVEQRKKFVEQGKWKDDENKAHVDESYLDALEWGLPPTGGWGCGIDRLVMLLTGATRISDVLPFGSLRNVVNLGSAATDDKLKSKSASKKEKVADEDKAVDDTKEEFQDMCHE